MSHKTRKIIYIFILLVLVGCKRQPHYQNTIKKKEFAPKSLNELSKEIETIMDSVGNIEKASLGIDLKDIEKKEEKDEVNKENENKSEEKDGEDGQGNGQQNTQQDEGQSSQEFTEKENRANDKLAKEQMKNQIIEIEWNKVDKKLEKIYSLWNEYGTEGLKKGATDENSQEVEDTLNKLVKGVEDREIFIVYNYGSRSLKALAPYYNLYRDEIGGEVLSLKHMVYQYYINTVKESRNTAEMHISSSEEYINKIRLKWEDEKDKTDKKQDIDEVAFAFKNLSNSLAGDSRRALLLKKDTLIKNLNSLEN